MLPDRATMWSGQLPHNHGVVDNYTGDNLDLDWIASRYLRDAGYTTALVGKFITNWNWRYEPPHFDDFAVFQGGYKDSRFMVKQLGNAKTHTERAPYTTDWIGEKAAAFVDGFESRDDQPWFMQVAPTLPIGTDRSRARLLQPREDVLVAGALRRPADPAVEADTGRGDRGRAQRQGREAGQGAVGEERQLHAQVRPGHLRRRHEDVDGGRRHGRHGHDPAAGPGRAGQHARPLEHRQRLLVERAGDDEQGGAVDRARPGTAAGPVGRGVPAGHEGRAPRRHGGLPPDLARRRGVPAARDPLPVRRPFVLPNRPARTEKYLELGPVLKTSPKEYKGHRGIPAWASLRTKAWQYIEFYEKDNNTDVHWREYYDLAADPWELNNLLADKTRPTTLTWTRCRPGSARRSACAGTPGADPAHSPLSPHPRSGSLFF